MDKQFLEYFSDTNSIYERLFRQKAVFWVSFCRGDSVASKTSSISPMSAQCWFVGFVLWIVLCAKRILRLLYYVLHNISVVDNILYCSVQFEPFELVSAVELCAFVCYNSELIRTLFCIVFNMMWFGDYWRLLLWTMLCASFKHLIHVCANCTSILLRVWWWTLLAL